MAIEETKKAYTRLPPAEPDPNAVVARTDPKMAKVLVSVDGKQIPIADLLVTVADEYHLPQTPTAWLRAATLLTAATTTVATTGSADVKGNQVTITLKPEIKPVLEAKAKEAK